ncbi:MAG: HAD family hydrolase [Spirulina sp. SIO3F2]|nr:HAD family hydrolase [Spirulina sp. SIO3F2]
MVTLGCENVTFSNIKAIVFDKDGTLENSSDTLRELAIKRARLIDAQIPGIGDPLLMAFGLLDNQLDSQGLMAVGSRQENLIAAAAYIAETGRAWPEAIAIAQSTFAQADDYLHNAPASPLFEGVRPTLERLQQADVQLAVLSASTNDAVQKFIQAHQLEAVFPVALGHIDDGLVKPDPALFHKVCQQLQCAPQDVVMVGDSGFDWQMARAAGAGGVVGIRWGNAALVPAGEVDVAIADLQSLMVV